MKNNNQINVPQAREAGSIGGQMTPVRTAKFDRLSRTAMGHVQKVEYIAALTA